MKISKDQNMSPEADINLDHRPLKLGKPTAYQELLMLLEALCRSQLVGVEVDGNSGRLVRSPAVVMLWLGWPTMAKEGLPR